MQQIPYYWLRAAVGRGSPAGRRSAGLRQRPRGRNREDALRPLLHQAHVGAARSPHPRRHRLEGSRGEATRPTARRRRPHTRSADSFRAGYSVRRGRCASERRSRRGSFSRHCSSCHLTARARWTSPSSAATCSSRWKTAPFCGGWPTALPRRVLVPTVAGTGEGMAFDNSGNLYVARWCNDTACGTGNTVEMYDRLGLSLGPTGSGYNCNPHAIVFDSRAPTSARYVGQAGLQEIDPEVRAGTDSRPPSSWSPKTARACSGSISRPIDA